MATELVTFKMEKKFLAEVDKTAKASGYQSRTEFIREALRAKMDKEGLRKAMKEIAHLKGAAKRKTTEAEYEMIREDAFEQLAKEKGLR